MEGDLLIRKVFVDSRFRSEGTNSDFTIDLPFSIETVQNTVAFVDDITVPHSWTSIGDNNRYLYIAERVGSSSPYNYVIRKLDIPFSNYNGNTYKTALQTALNTNLVGGVTANYVVTFSITTNKCTITAPSGSEFHFLTDTEIAQNDLAHYLI